MVNFFLCCKLNAEGAMKDMLVIPGHENFYVFRLTELSFISVEQNKKVFNLLLLCKRQLSFC